MRRTAHPERIDIMPEPLTLRVKRGVHALHPLGELCGVVDPLGAGDDFLAAHEGVVGVGQRRGGGREVRVEGPGGGGVVRQEVEVGVVPFEDEAAEGFLVWGAGAGRKGSAACPMGWNRRGLKEQERNVRREVPNIFVCGGFDAGFVEHLDAISKA